MEPLSNLTRAVLQGQMAGVLLSPWPWPCSALREPTESVRTHSKAGVPSLSLVISLFSQNGCSQGCDLDFAFTDSSMETPLRNLLLEAYWKKLLAQDVIAGFTLLPLPSAVFTVPSHRREHRGCFLGQDISPTSALVVSLAVSRVSSAVCTSQA